MIANLEIDSSAEFDPAADPPAAPPRSWWQFSLRTMFILFTLLAIALGWFLNGPERQRRASERIRAAGGMLGFESYLLPIRDYRDGPGQEKGWLPREYTERLKWMEVEGKDWKDADLAILADLPALEKCFILQGPSTHWKQTEGPDASLGISEKGLASLSGLTRLKDLYLIGLTVNDKGMACLAPLSDLAELSIDWAEITDEGLAPLANKTNLQILELCGANCSDAGLERLSRCTKLTRLRLGGKGITDAGLRHLSGMDQLDYLELRWTSITDAGLRHLCHPHLKKLVWIDLAGSKVTKAGADQLELDRKAISPDGIRIVLDS